MSERLTQSNEHERVNHEQLEAAGEKQREQLREQFDKRAETSQERQEASARHEALEAAKSVEKETKKEKASPAEKRREAIRPTKKTVKASYKKELQHIQAELPVASRAFSKVIHNPVIERVSDVAAETVARPNAILSAAIFGFVLTAGVYMVARYFGYPLSGFETIGAMIVGWIVGIMFDFIRIMVTGKK